MGNGTDTFTYAYTTNSNLLASVTKSGSPTIQTTHTWEPNRNVLDVKENKVGSTVISSYDYSVNALGQRTAVDTAGTAFAAGERDRTWTYDALGQVTAESDANNTAYHRGFAYDAIGNRLASIEGSTDPTQPGATTYTPTALNQYSQISAPSVPSVVPTYDDDGNQLASQIRPLGASGFESCLFVWDGENRLIEIKDATGTNILAQYTYDSQSRRIARTVAGTALATIYDGWNPIAEYSGTPATGYSLQASYSWGLDLSGSMQGAGGVGGLLSVTSGSTSFYPTYDGNGNVGEYLDAAGAIAAHYEYDAFGNVIFSSGTSAASFQHRFSTKPQDAESGLYYYGYRYYDPVMGRWPSRDPIGERGGVNLYGFIGNASIYYIDILGLEAGEGDKAHSEALWGTFSYRCEIVIFYGHNSSNPEVGLSASNAVRRYRENVQAGVNAGTIPASEAGIAMGLMCNADGVNDSVPFRIPRIASLCGVTSSKDCQKMRDQGHSWETICTYNNRAYTHEINSDHSKTANPSPGDFDSGAADGWTNDQMRKARQSVGWSRMLGSFISWSQAGAKALCASNCGCEEIVVRFECPGNFASSNAKVLQRQGYVQYLTPESKEQYRKLLEAPIGCGWSTVIPCSKSN